MKKTIITLSSFFTIVASGFIFFNFTEIGSVNNVNNTDIVEKVNDDLGVTSSLYEYSVSEKGFSDINKVVLITIDILRADHLGFMGYPRETSPFLDKLASKSILFKNAHTVSSTTGPVDASIFTSLYPIQHKMSNNNQKLDESFITMAELLKDNGYKTAAFVGVKHLLWNNLDQGFDIFDSPTNKDKLARSSKKTIDLAINWINENKDEDKIFLWIHLYDAHYPNKLNVGIKEILKLDDENKKELIKLLTEKQGINMGTYYDDENNMLEIINRYDNEVAFMDRQIEKLYSWLQKNNLNNNTMWIMASEHGEGLGSHNYYEHTSELYEEQLHTPILFHFPFLEYSKVVDNQVEVIDILPTIADVINFSLKSQILKIQGVSLFPLILGEYDYYKDNNVFSWTGDIQRRAGANNDRYKNQSKIDFSNSNYSGEKFALQNEDFKYIYNTISEDEFYNLKDDPMEKNNLILDSIKEKDIMRKELMDRINGFLNEGDNVKSNYIDSNLSKELESLGYFR